MARNNEVNSLVPDALKKAGNKAVVGLVAAAALSGCATEAKQNNAPVPQADSYSAPANPSADLPPTSASPQETNQQSYPEDEITPLDKLPTPETVDEATGIAAAVLPRALAESMWAQGRPANANQGDGTLDSQRTGEKTPPLAPPIDMPFGSVTVKYDDYGTVIISANIFRNNGHGEVVKLAVSVIINDSNSLEDRDHPKNGFNERSIEDLLEEFEAKTLSIEILRGNPSDPGSIDGEIYDELKIASLSEGEKKALIKDTMDTLEEIADGYYHDHEKVWLGATPAVAYMSPGAVEAGVK